MKHNFNKFKIRLGMLADKSKKLIHRNIDADDFFDILGDENVWAIGLGKMITQEFVALTGSVLEQLDEMADKIEDNNRKIKKLQDDINAIKFNMEMKDLVSKKDD